LQALQKQNRQLAYSVILRDHQIDELEKEIDRLCLEFIVRQQPVAEHLRFVYATIKINAELERIGDYAESIARQTLKISLSETQAFVPRFERIAELAIPMLGKAIEAFVEQNAELARKTMSTEEEVDLVRNEINADLLKARQEGRISLESLTPLMTIARRFERVSDQAKNICEEVLYMCTGQYHKHKDTEVVRILFVDEHNSSRSQMAEGIANSLGQARLLFASAGIDPKPIDPALVKFLKDKGIDISSQHSKAPTQVPNLDHYQVIIALSPEAKKVFPSPPTKTVTFEWNVGDPSKARGTTPEVRAVYEETYRYLFEHIQDLADAILGNNQ
jgi:phosphate transport system protein